MLTQRTSTGACAAHAVCLYEFLRPISYFFLFWVTLRNGRQYHVTLAPNFFRGETTGIFRLEDLQDVTSTGATVFAPGTGSNETLNFRSEIQNLTSPVGGDNYTNLHISTDYAGVKLNVDIIPTGKNLYVGGSGGITLSSKGQDFRSLIPGYSWYWVWIQSVTKALCPANSVMIG